MDRTLWCNLYYAVSQVIGKENLNTTVAASSICTVWFYYWQTTVNLFFIPRQLRVTSKKSALHMSHLRPITLGLQLQLPYNWNEMKKYKSINIRLKIAACGLFHQSITFLRKHIQENSDDSSSLQTSNISENFFFPMAPLPCGCKRVRNDVYQKTRAGEMKENLSYPSQNLSFSFGPEFQWPV